MFGWRHTRGHYWSFWAFLIELFGGSWFRMACCIPIALSRMSRLLSCIRLVCCLGIAVNILLLRTSGVTVSGPGYRLATGWTVRGSDPGGGEIFRTRPVRPWLAPFFLGNGYRVSVPGVKRSGRGVDHLPLSSAVDKERILGSVLLHGLLQVNSNFSSCLKISNNDVRWLVKVVFSLCVCVCVCVCVWFFERCIWNIPRDESHRWTLHFVKSLQILTNKCTYIIFT